MLSLFHYYPSEPSRWTGRIDDDHDTMAFRIHQAVQCVELNKLPQSESKAFAILGFSCDEGVRRNQGRVGASEGPIAIRKELAKLPANFVERASLYDVGDIRCESGNLELAQTELSQAVEHLVRLGYRPIVLGGGHEIVYGHYTGLRTAVGGTKPPILVNLDAHLDLRSFQGGGTSGTSFYQIATDHKAAGLPFDYVCLGTQTYGNTRRLYARAEELGVTVIDAKDMKGMDKQALMDVVLKRVEAHEHIYLTLDMDAIDAANAPGVSSPSPFGIDPELYMYLIKGIIATGKLVSMDIAEVSPRYDRDSRTAKLAAIIMYSVFDAWLDSDC